MSRENQIAISCHNTTRIFKDLRTHRYLLRASVISLRARSMYNFTNSTPKYIQFQNDDSLSTANKGLNFSDCPSFSFFFFFFFFFSFFFFFFFFFFFPFSPQTVKIARNEPSHTRKAQSVANCRWRLIIVQSIVTLHSPAPQVLMACFGQGKKCVEMSDWTQVITKIGPLVPVTKRFDN